MGAVDFTTRSKGKTADEAFQAARERAQWESGHGGYSGTIAEKHSFVMIPLEEGVKPRDKVQELLDNDDPRIDDKWGPAGCIDCKDGSFLFFGYASY